MGKDHPLKDHLDFLLKANKGSKFLSLKKAASGGELSRIMLAIKSILSKYQQLPTIMFDEIDTGVSGNVASKMANLMKRIARHQQVIAVTHLPQVAATAEQHLRVQKEETEGTTRTLVQLLDQDVRVLEIAAMLSGSEVSAAAKDNAAALIADHGN